MRYWAVPLALFAVIVALPSRSGEAARAAQPAQKEAIQAAIDKGLAWLRGRQGGDGSWSGGGGGGIGMAAQGFGLGPTALAGIAMLECGVPSTDPQIVRAAAFIRASALAEWRTYQLSLAIMFLDRNHDFNDVPLITILAIRLMLGQQQSTGGWGYNCLSGPMPPQEVRRLMSILPPNADAKAFKIEREIPFQVSLKSGGGGGGPGADGGGGGGLSGSDNSNTQFATMALWIASRHGIAERVSTALALIDRRYRATQFPQGGWSYYPSVINVASEGPTSGMTPSMTCAGLIGLAVAYGINKKVSILRADRKDGGNAGGGGSTVRASKDPNSDPAIRGGLKALGEFASAKFNQQVDVRRDMYFLWSLERVCVVYGVTKIGGKDWHAWGNEYILSIQQQDGGFPGPSIHPGTQECETAFALLFLKASNLVSDLSSILKGGSKPDDVSAKAGGAGEAPMPKEGTLPKVQAGNAGTPAAAAPSKHEAKVAKLAAALTSAGSKSELLTEYATASGPEYTEVLAKVIPQLKGAEASEAREALIKRMRRIDADSLRAWLQDREGNAEGRIAAAKAVGLKSKKEMVPDLIDALQDPEAAVMIAARDSLRELSGKEFGPGDNGSDKDAAINKWKAWWKAQPVPKKKP